MKIHISSNTKVILETFGSFQMECRGEILCKVRAFSSLSIKKNQQKDRSEHCIELKKIRKQIRSLHNLDQRLEMWKKKNFDVAQFSNVFCKLIVRPINSLLHPHLRFIFSLRKSIIFHSVNSWKLKSFNFIFAFFILFLFFTCFFFSFDLGERIDDNILVDRRDILRRLLKNYCT
jgi:hypothetical protein